MAENNRNEAGSSSRSNNRGESVVVDVGRRRSSCGYCKSGAHTSLSHGQSFRFAYISWQILMEGKNGLCTSRRKLVLDLQMDTIPKKPNLTVVGTKAMFKNLDSHTEITLSSLKLDLAGDDENSGLWAHSITVADYQDLLDRGWRRSGSFLYKPEMERTCCPSYTIRLKAGDFVHSKEQHRVSRRMQRFLDGTLDAKKQDLSINAPAVKGSSSSGSDEACSAAESYAGDFEEKNNEEQFVHCLSNQIDNAVHACARNGECPSDIQLPKASVKKVTETKRKLIEGSEGLLYSSNISFQIAATIRRSQSAEKDIRKLELSRHGADQNGPFLELSPNIIAENLASSLNNLADVSFLSIKACSGYLNFYSASKQASSGEGTVMANSSRRSSRGNGSKRSCMEKNIRPPQQKKRRLEIRLKRSSFDPEEYALYRRYQIKVHNDTPEHVMESSYRRFLVDTPIVFVPPSDNGAVPPCGFGSFHQQYVIDGKLVAVGVVDILPKCLSSKYLFWDPDLAFLSLGKYSALQEIGWVKENQIHCPSLQYYYLGYYIHSCSKMRYKAAYHPSELLCPLRYQWVSFDIAKPLLDKRAYVVLSDFAALQNGESSPHQVLENPVELQHHDPGQEDSSNILSDEDEDMMEPDFDDSEDDSGPETSPLASIDEIQDGDASNILIGLKGSHLRFKDLQGAFGPTEKKYLESRLHRYMKAVGKELSECMVYSLG
ncbi:hypothetical protein HHK36_016217 [Tetracentron sinense]|uniref:arginyltransferase n=1 Tax=Tetracentron sinense TaxID=13715 RepID=A0A834YWS7_TETSI|nr:hypothetical protein HHK36_016217 [Tetracentron sinense]